MNTDVGVLLRSALDQLPNGIVVLDDENKLAFANKSALMLQGTCRDCLTWGASSTPTRIPLTDDAGCQLGTLVLTGDVSVSDRPCSRRGIAGRCVSIVESAVIAGLERVVACLELRDPHTKGHSDRVKDLAVAMAGRTLRNMAILPIVALSARLHDIGKTRISSGILKKPGPLADEEWAEVRRHPVVGADMLSSVLCLDAVVQGVRHHHERYDGKGYPQGLAGPDIPLVARIIAVADSYDAMTSERPYRKALRPSEAASEVVRNAGAQFDPDWAEALFQIVMNSHAS
ncbi:MAG: HD domain-containing phosphohydrolase [Bacillota bacterium]